MRSPPPPRVLAAWLVPFALYAFVLYAFVLPVVTMLVVLAASGAYGYSFSNFSLAPLLPSVLYWFSRFGDVDRSTGSAGSIEFGLATPRSTFNYGPSDRSKTTAVPAPAGARYHRTVCTSSASFWRVCWYTWASFRRMGIAYPSGSTYNSR